MRQRYLLPCLLLISMLYPATADAQRVLIHESVPPAGGVPAFGPNRKHFHHIYSGFGFVTNLGALPEARIHFGNSWEYFYGIRYKRRFSQVFSGGGEMYFSRLSFHPVQNEDKQVPDNQLHDKEKFVILQPGGALYQRINYDKHRGNYIGRFIDVGIWGQWHGNFRHISRSTVDGETRRVRTSGMDYYNTYSWGLLGRVGLNNFVIRGNYRLSNIFRNESNIPELPRFTIGIEFGVHPL